MRFIAVLSNGSKLTIEAHHNGQAIACAKAIASKEHTCVISVTEEDV